MSKRNWKKHRSTSLIGAIRDCKDFALDVHGRSVARIADLSGQTEDCLYKWNANGRMPSIVIKPYELACGCSFITEFLAASSDRLVIDMPKGRTSSPSDLVDLSTTFSQAFKLLNDFYQGKANQEETQASIKLHLEQFAWHHRNVGSHATPELEFGA
ncbi:MAG: hypothetical protein RSD57_00065 [Comamonas sp.]